MRIAALTLAVLGIRADIEFEVTYRNLRRRYFQSLHLEDSLLTEATAGLEQTHLQGDRHGNIHFTHYAHRVRCRR